MYEIKGIFGSRHYLPNPWNCWVSRVCDNAGCFKGLLRVDLFKYSTQNTQCQVRRLAYVHTAKKWTENKKTQL